MGKLVIFDRKVVISETVRDRHMVTVDHYVNKKPRDAFRGQSRSQNMIPFDMLGMVSY